LSDIKRGGRIMDANVIIDKLLERIKNLTRENVFLQAHIEHLEGQLVPHSNGDSNNEEVISNEF